MLFKHTEHGYTNAFSDLDQRTLKENGWEECLSPPSKEKPAKIEVVQETPKKRGRPAKGQ